jgi:tetratricopeptide (TPR) repeat protein
MDIEYNSERRSLKYTLPACLFLTVSLGFLRRIYDYDLWFHLAIGKQILANLRIPQTELFVYPLLGTPGAYHEWGFEALLYFLYSHFGYWGISCLQGMVAGFLTVFLYLAVRNEGAREGLSLLFLAGLVTLVQFRFVYRPEIILYLFLAIEIYLLERFSSTKKWKWLTPFPVLCMVLSWFHPSALLLLIVLSCYCAGFLWDWLMSRKIEKKMVRALGLTIFFSILFACINPYGIRQLLLPILFSGEKAYLVGVPEFAPMLDTVYKNRFILLVLFGLTPVISLKGGRRIAYGLLFSIFGFLAFKYARNLAMLAVVMYVPIVLSFQTLAEKSSQLSMALSKKPFPVIAAVLLIASLFSAAGGGRWGAGPADELFPVMSAQFMLEQRPKGKIFNHYHTGNYLEWKLYPAYLVSIDGRHYTADKSLKLYEQVFWAEKGWEKVLMDYDAGTIITPGTNIVTGSLVPLVLEMDADPSWSLAVIEPGAMLFIKTELLRNLDGVHALNKDFIWRQVIQEASKNLRLYPDAVKSYLSLGIAYFKLHEFRDALVPFRKYLEHFPNDPQAIQVVTLIESAEQGSLSSKDALEALYRSSRQKAD